MLVDDEFVRIGDVPHHSECDRYLHGRRSAGVVRLRGGPRAAAEAREELAARGASLEPSMRAQADLLLTELVTNAVRHGGAHSGETVGVRFHVSAEVLRVAVTDPGPGFVWQPPPTAGPPRASGYGLVLVDEVAQRWGIKRSADRNIVWFEIWQESVT